MVTKAAIRSLFLILALSVATFSQTAGKAIVYVYTYSASTTIGTVRKPVFLDDKEIADIRPEKFFIALIEPGKHTFSLKNKKLGGIEKEFEAGKTYYLRVDWRSGAKLSPQGFVSVNEENGAYDVRQLKPIDKKNIKDPNIAVLSLN
jgi:hypothetical protein